MLSQYGIALFCHLIVLGTLVTSPMQIKQGEVHEAVSIAMGLVSSGQPLEVQHFGYQLLQALVRPPTRPMRDCACQGCTITSPG